MQDWDRRLDRLLLEWFDIGSIEPADGDEPRCVRVLRAADAVAPVFGVHNELIAPGPPGPGAVAVVRENQSLWTIGYRPDGTDAPDAVFFDHHTDHVFLHLRRALPRVLYQATFIEAVFSQDAVCHGLILPEAQIEALTPFLTAPELTDGDLVRLPATWDLGDALVMGFSDQTFFAGARDPSTLQGNATLASMGTWSLFDEP